MTREYQTPLGQQTKEQMEAVRSDNEWEVSYMTFRQKLDEECRESYAEGAAKATISKLRFDLQNLMQYTGWTLEQAMEALNVPGAEREEYMKLLNQQE